MRSLIRDNRVIPVASVLQIADYGNGTAGRGELTRLVASSNVSSSLLKGNGGDGGKY